MDGKSLDRLYLEYRFQRLPLSNENVRAYSYTSKYFSNADIVCMNANVTQEQISYIEKEVSDLGFSTSVRTYRTIEDAEESLFDGFFDIKNSQLELRKSYDDYKLKISELILGPYEYIKSEFFNAQTETYESYNLVETICNDFNSQGPLLIVLEAAAGFGKTSTSFEVLDKLITISDKKVPLFTELSRNRQATIFKYVLYDEINRKFTGLSLELVLKNIVEGRIPVIIDGFDELLKTSQKEHSEEEYRDAEPMLETIKELLNGQAKILLTTRKTAIFAGDDFHTWIEKNSENFSFKRYSISLPVIEEWVSPTRSKLIEKTGLNIKSISNPVLLSYLRCMDDDLFEKSISNIDLLVEDYFNKLMDREKIRQELIMSPDEQKKILEVISTHFVEQDITSDTKEAIERLLQNTVQKDLFAIVERYSSDKKITIDQLVSKITMHAFLDRKGDNEQRIGFVNDFILGTFVGQNLQKSDDEWLCTERFIDYVVQAYTSRAPETKRKIYEILERELTALLSTQKQIFIDVYLEGGINHDIFNEFFNDLEFKYHFNFQKKIQRCIFSECIFRDVHFSFSEVLDVHFINCQFFNCQMNPFMGLSH